MKGYKDCEAVRITNWLNKFNLICLYHVTIDCFCEAFQSTYTQNPLLYLRGLFTSRTLILLMLYIQFIFQVPFVVYYLYLQYCFQSSLGPCLSLLEWTYSILNTWNLMVDYEVLETGLFITMSSFNCLTILI